MKRFAAVLTAFLLAFVQLPAAVFASGGLVSDTEGVLTSEEQKSLRSQVTGFVASYGIDIAIAIRETSGPLLDAAQSIYEEEGCGEGDDDAGVILLMDPGRVEMTVASFGSASAYLNEIWADSFLESSSEKLAQLDYYGVANDFIYQADNILYASAEQSQRVSHTPLLSSGETSLDLEQKVYDYANLLTDSEEQTLAAEVREFTEQYQLDLALVTTADAEGKSSMAYADDFYDYNGFGVGANHDGLLLLIDMDHRMVWLSTTGAAIQLFRDSRIQEITDNAASHLKDADYFGGCRSALSAISETVRSSRELETFGGRARRSARRLPIYLVIAAALSGITVAVMARKGKTARMATDAVRYLDRDSVRLTVREDQFIRSSVTRSKIETSSSSGGGGSSTHSGSSGTSHGGGGSSF